MWILLLIPLAIFRKKRNLVMLLLLVNIISLPAKADWGVAIKYGASKAKVNQEDLNQQLANLGADAQVTALDDKSGGWGVDAVYRFDQGPLEHWLMMLGYQNLGTFAATISGQAVDPEDFQQLVEQVQPQSADGWTASVAYQFMLSERFFAQGQLGLFNWQSKSGSQPHSGSFSATSVNHSGHDLFYGGELGYKLLENVEASIFYNHYSLDKNAVASLGIGVKYYY